MGNAFRLTQHRGEVIAEHSVGAVAAGDGSSVLAAADSDPDARTAPVKRLFNDLLIVARQLKLEKGKAATRARTGPRFSRGEPCVRP